MMAPFCPTRVGEQTWGKGLDLHERLTSKKKWNGVHMPDTASRRDSERDDLRSEAVQKGIEHVGARTW